MDTSIYYYSATGNSFYVANRISEALAACELQSIPALRQEKKIVPKGKAVGLVFPMHYFGVPPLVKAFVEKLDFKQVEYIFVVATCGNPVMSSVLHEMSWLLQKRDRSLDAGFYVKMVDNYLPMFTIPELPIQQKILRKSDEVLAAIIPKLSAQVRCIDKESLWWLCRPIHYYWLKKFPKIDFKFTNAEHCTSCGLCVKACPVENINMVNNRPAWQHHCQECLACLHICPCQSIQFGNTKHKRRYHNPSLTWDDIITAQRKK